MTEIFSFKGRIRRSKFWGLLVLLFVIAVMAQATIATDGDDGSVSWLTGAGVIGFILTTWASLATYAKRWHDIGLSGWMSLTLLIPFVGVLIFLYLGFSRGNAEANKYGEVLVGSKTLGVSGLEFSDEGIKTEPLEDERP